jgi:hypothetical protein
METKPEDVRRLGTETFTQPAESLCNNHWLIPQNSRKKQDSVDVSVTYIIDPCSTFLSPRKKNERNKRTNEQSNDEQHIKRTNID